MSSIKHIVKELIIWLDFIWWSFIENSYQVYCKHALHLHFSDAAAQLNMRGVFLHVLGDALGSVVVIISALIIKYAEGDWRFYIDPALSLAIVFIIISSTIPLCKYRYCKHTLFCVVLNFTNFTRKAKSTKILASTEYVYLLHSFCFCLGVLRARCLGGKS